jgi:hypothetical protein
LYSVNVIGVANLSRPEIEGSKTNSDLEKRAVSKKSVMEIHALKVIQFEKMQEDEQKHYRPVRRVQPMVVAHNQVTPDSSTMEEIRRRL